MLGMDGLTSYWNKLGKQLVQKVAGKFVNIFDRFIGSGLLDLLNLLKVCLFFYMLPRLKIILLGPLSECAE